MSGIIPLRRGVPPTELIPHTAAWHEWRRAGIGGSDAPVITGDHPFRTELTLWLDKAGYLDHAAEDEDDSPRWWGRRLEDSVIDRFQLDTGLLIINRQTCVEHHLDRWRRATLDGLVFDSADVHGAADEPNALGIFEGKMTSKTHEWEEGPPTHVQIQVQHNLDVCEVDNAWVGVLFTAPVVHFKHYELQRDESICAPLRELERLFWQRVLDHNPPSAVRDDLEALKRAYRDHVTADAIELQTSELMPSVEEIVSELSRAREQKSEASRREETAQALLAAMLGEHETGTVGGVPVIHWKRHDKAFVDVDALRAAHPKIVERFTSRRPYRQFSIPRRSNDGNGTR